MMFVIGDNFVNYALCTDLKKAHKAGVFEEMGIESEQEDRYVSELERRMKALDAKSVYIAVKSFAEEHRETVIRTLEYLDDQQRQKQREGEKRPNGKRENV